MGAANNWLIPPAILYNNPGITKEEFVELLNETRTGYGSLAFHNFKSWKKAPWDFVGSEDYDYHEGLHGLAKILGLNHTREFKKIKWKDKDREGFPLSSPSLWIRPFLSNEKWQVSYEVSVHIGNNNSESEKAEGWEFEITKEGDIFQDYYSR